MYELYNGDCLPYLREMPDKSVYVVTDPPYGIANVWKGGSSHGWGVASLATPHRNSWDDQPPAPEVFDEILRIAISAVIWGGNYFTLPPSRGWLIWNKPERGFTLAEAELAWTSKDFPMRVFDCHRSDSGRVHPTQKPLDLMKWCLDVMKIPQGATVLDPFAGSGTTGIACLQTGRDCILIERDPHYFAVMEKRIQEAQP